MQYHWHWLMGYGFYIMGEHEKSILIWKQLEEYLVKRPLFNSKTRLGIALTQQMVNYLETRDYSSGAACAARCFGYFKAGFTNRLIFMEYYFLLCIQNQQYQNAIIAYNMTLKDKSLQDMPKYNRE